MVRSHAGVPFILVFLLGWFQGHLGEAGFRVHWGEAVCLGLAFCFLSFIVHRPLGLAGTVLVALRLRSLWFHSPRLCRVAVFLIQTNVSLRYSQQGIRCPALLAFFAQGTEYTPHATHIATHRIG